MKTFNRIMLTGDLAIGVDLTGLIETSEQGMNRVYTEELKVYLPEGSEASKPGRYALKGRLDALTLEDDGGIKTIIAIEEMKKAKKATPDMNVGRLCGTMYNSFDLLDSNPDRKTMGWGLVQVGDQLYRFVAFSGLAHRLANGNSRHPAAKKGAEIQVQGRLRIREYGAEGNIRKMVEIVADPDWTKVTKEAEIIDVFADEMPDDDDAAAEAI